MVECQDRRFYRGGIAEIGGKAILVLLLALSGCHPIETYRSWVGVSANDPNPETTPNSKNLAAGDARGYPNLATVPPPPTQALTTAQLNKLTQDLIADRANAKYTSEHLQAQFDESAAPPPPPPAAPPRSVAGATPPAPAIAGQPPAAAAATTPPVAKSPAAQPGTNPGAAGSAATALLGTSGKGARKPGQPPEPEPMESTLQSPQIASLPQPQAGQPAPPPPRELSAPAAANPAATAPGAHLPGPPPVPPMPAAIGSAKFQPAPPPPNLPPPEPVRTATAAGSGKTPPPAAAFTKVADIAFSGNATALNEADRQTLDKILPRYRTKPGLVRVVGYAGVASNATEQLNSYQTALNRAQAVANGLTKAGIPANKIQVEAAPSGSDAGQGRAEILFEQ
jgi:outer membrane protein OmpA-like peptidoglycan-associated protein